MKISLILCTYGRTEVVFDFIEALRKQTYANFELIVVDQNLTDRLTEGIKAYSEFMSITHVHSLMGLSRSRNVGLSLATGDVLCFPDDDCVYPPDLLGNIHELFRDNPQIDFLLGKAIDPDTGEVVAGKNINKPMLVTCKKFGGSSITLFINRKTEKAKSFYFDEDFGIGAPFHSEEENDLIMRMLHAGKQGLYVPERNFVFHPKKDADYFDIERASQRGYGFGALVGKHIRSLCGVSYFFRYFFVRTPASFVISAAAGNIEKTRYVAVKYVRMWMGLIEYISARGVMSKKQYRWD